LIAKAQKGFSIIDANGIKITNAQLDIEAKNAFEIYNTQNLSLKNIEFNSGSSNTITINGQASKNIDLSGSNLSKTTTIGKDVPKKAVKF
jgi:hypothetical protein